MNQPNTVEDRLASLEREVDDLKHRLAGGPPNPRDGWVDRITGIMEGDPVFEEVVRLGREARAADRPQDENGD
jgi:hypothetical protein